VGPLILLTVRQLGSRWRLLIIVLLAALPIVITVLRSDHDADSDFDLVLLDGMLAAAIVPLVTLSVAAAAFGNEIEDRTLSFLTLTPIARWRIVLPKFLAPLAVSAPLLLISAVVSAVIAYEGDARAALAVAVAIFTGAVLYTSVFVWAGLVTGRALAFGLIYVFLWEGLFASFVDGIKYLSIREYILGLIKGIDPDRFTGAGQSTVELPAAAAGAAIVFTVFFLLSVRRLRNMDVP
jgi:ABC-type transport system involved in multi-copper enzyme maturation permease subunit